jgi:hypothetical protein
MKLKVFLLLLLFHAVMALERDPFLQRSQSKVKSLSALKKYRYHGYLKVNQEPFGIIKMVGSDYELLNLGVRKGLGKVIRINARQICILRKAKQYCLTRSDSAKTWEPQSD